MANFFLFRYLYSVLCSEVENVFPVGINLTKHYTVTNHSWKSGRGDFGIITYLLCKRWNYEMSLFCDTCLPDFMIWTQFIRVEKKYLFSIYSYLKCHSVEATSQRRCFSDSQVEYPPPISRQLFVETSKGLLSSLLTGP